MNSWALQYDFPRPPSHSRSYRRTRTITIDLQDILGSSRFGLADASEDDFGLERTKIEVKFRQNTDRVIDAGGPFRTWLVLVSEQLFSHKAGLFLPSKLGSDTSMLQINPCPGRGCELECFSLDLGDDGLLTDSGTDKWYRFAGQILGLTLRAAPCCLGEWANFVPPVYKLLLNLDRELPFDDLRYLHESLHKLMCQCRRRILAKRPEEVAWTDASNDEICASGGGDGSGAQARRHVRLVTTEPHHLDSGQHFVAPLSGGDGGGFDGSCGVMRLQVVWVESPTQVIAEVVDAGCVAAAAAPTSLRELSDRSVVRKLAELGPVAATDGAAAGALPPLSFDSFIPREDFVNSCLLKVYEEVYKHEIAAATTPGAKAEANERKRKRCAAANAAVVGLQAASGAPGGGGGGGGDGPDLGGLPLPVRNGSDLSSTPCYAECDVTAENVDEWVDETSTKMLSLNVNWCVECMLNGIQDVLLLNDWVKAAAAPDYAAAAKACRAVSVARKKYQSLARSVPEDLRDSNRAEGNAELPGGLAQLGAATTTASEAYPVSARRRRALEAAERALSRALAVRRAAKAAARLPAWQRLRRALRGRPPAPAGGVDVEEWRRCTLYLAAHSGDSAGKPAREYEQVEWFWSLVTNHADADAIARAAASGNAAAAAAAVAGAARAADMEHDSDTGPSPAAGGAGGAVWGFTGSGRKRSFREALLEFITALPALPALPAVGSSCPPVMTIHLTDLEDPRRDPRPSRGSVSESVNGGCGGGGGGADVGGPGPSSHESNIANELGGYPKASTCSQTLYLPRYRSEATLRERLVMAVLEWMRSGRGNYTRS